MAFLDNEPNLDGWRYSQRDLENAKQYLKSALERHAPGWIATPRGGLAVHWRGDGPYPASYLIHLSIILHTLDKSITAKSVSILREKFKSLLKLSGPQFDELATELEIAAALVERFSPISFEPFVPEERASPSKPKSPDFALRLPEADVSIEATVLRIGFLDKWDRESTWLSDELSRIAGKRGISASIELLLPIGFKKQHLAKNAVSKILSTVAAAPSGEAPLPMLEGEGTFTWKPVSVFEGMPNGHIEERATTELPPGIAHAIAVFRRPKAGSDFNDQIVRSLRNTLDSKRRQRVSDSPYLLALRLGHHRLRRDGIEMLLDQRIWPNPQYHGVSGIIFYVRPAGFGATDAPHSLWLHLNPNATFGVPHSMILGFEGKAQFHLP